MERSAIADPLVGRLVDGRYRVEAPIARGGMATVYAATDLRLDRRVALKVMPHTLADDEDFTQRFVREARAAARLTHPNVVAVYDQGDDNGVVFLAMEFVDGKHTLRDVIRDEAPLPPIRALTILEDVLRALAAAHESGIVHRDVKPENVLITPRGEVKVADFGLARAISSATTATATGGVLMGTVSYLPPELVVDGTADARSDVYSAGVLLFELLTGVKPHVGDTPIQIAYKHVHADVPAPSMLVEGIPRYLDALVARATSRQRDLRPADAHVLLQQLRRVRSALEHGVSDDQELTNDLTPTVAVARGGDDADLGGWSRRDEVFDQEASADRLRTMIVGSPAFDATPTDIQAVQPPGLEHTPAYPTAGAPSVLPALISDASYGVDPYTANGGSGPPARLAAPTRPRRRRRRGWIAFLLVVVLAAGAALAGWYYGVGRFQSTPQLVGLSQQAATQKARQAGLTLQIVGSAFSDTVPAGELVSTQPVAGAHVTKGGTVKALISKGPEMHAVPELGGVSQTVAEQRLRSAHLQVGRVRQIWSDKVPEGSVISFSPVSGTPLRSGGSVGLVVSTGPEPIAIPDYTNKAAGPGAAALAHLGFIVHQTRAYSDTVAAGLVISQSPASGIGHHGDDIVMMVSRGPHLVRVPDVIGQNETDAVAALKTAGFTPNVHTSFGFDHVIIETPGSGNMEPYGSTVTIYID